MQPAKGEVQINQDHNKDHIMTNMDITKANAATKVISPAQHAVLDYGVATTFFAFGISVFSRHRPAAALALANGDDPGNVASDGLSRRRLSNHEFEDASNRGHGPSRARWSRSILFGFGKDPEANYFYGQAASEAGVIAATDWDVAA